MEVIIIRKVFLSVIIVSFMITAGFVPTEKIIKVNKATTIKEKPILIYEKDLSEESIDLTPSPETPKLHINPSRCVVPEKFGYLDNITNLFSDEILGGYYLGAGRGGSKTNALIASRAVNGTIIQPNSIFSFNEVVGKRTYSKGYVDGFVVVGNEYTTGIGGGICRVSTGLYNSALKSGLTIIERHSHTLPVGYAIKNKDAAVVYGQWDMKFKNNLENPIKILFTEEGGFLHFAIIELKEEPLEIDKEEGREQVDNQLEFPEEEISVHKKDEEKPDISDMDNYDEEMESLIN